LKVLLLLIKKNYKKALFSETSYSGLPKEPNELRYVQLNNKLIGNFKIIYLKKKKKVKIIKFFLMK
jgi:hypothetical protein